MSGYITRSLLSTMFKLFQEYTGHLPPCNVPCVLIHNPTVKENYTVKEMCYFLCSEMASSLLGHSHIELAIHCSYLPRVGFVGIILHALAIIFTVDSFSRLLPGSGHLFMSRVFNKCNIAHGHSVPLPTNHENLLLGRIHEKKILPLLVGYLVE